MADEFELNPSAVLGDRLSSLTPEQFVELIRALCSAVQNRETDFYGGVNPANISLTEDGAVGLGPELKPAADQHYAPDQIEYLAPEVFWKTECTPQADVYAIGMMMYTWVNGGCLPFLYPNPKASDRADALRRRMSGENFPIPQVSGTLAAIIAKATAYEPEQRYENCGALLDAFQVFAEEVEKDHGEALQTALNRQRERQAKEEQIMAGILAAAEAATAPQKSAAGQQPPVREKRSAPEKPAAQPEPEKKFNTRPLVAVLLIAAVLMIAAVAMQFTRRNPGQAEESPSPTPTLPAITETPAPTEDPDASPDVTEEPDASAEPTVSPDTTATPVPTATPTPTPTPVVTEKPYDNTNHKYQLIKGDVSWNTAADNCMNAGGNLVVINDEAEFKKVTELADSYGVEFVWVGGYRKNGKIVWVTGERSDYYPWAQGEPSYNDEDGTPENFLLLWKRNGVWTYNDSRDNPAAVFPKAYGGKIAYILETVE